MQGLPVRGQRTKTNARTRKGKAKTVANKKKVSGGYLGVARRDLSVPFKFMYCFGTVQIARFVNGANARLTRNGWGCQCHKTGAMWTGPRLTSRTLDRVSAGRQVKQLKSSGC